MVGYKLTVDYGEYNREFAEWAAPILERYEGLTRVSSLAKVLRKFEAMQDDHVDALQELFRPGPGRGASLKRYPLPYLGAHMAELSLFDGEFQRGLSTRSLATKLRTVSATSCGSVRDPSRPSR